LRYFLVVLVESVSYLIFLMPRFRFLNYIKSKYLSFFFGAQIGRGVVYYPGVWIFTGRKLFLGDGVDLAKGVLITTDGGVTIGDRTLVGYSTHILSSNHRIPMFPGKIFDAGHEKKQVTIGQDVWIGANCIILPGVEIGSGSVVAAGSVVTKSFPSGVIVAGVPARIIKERE
jgi:acetyltransferase-like isoleucine patch superfamily enzyme